MCPSILSTIFPFYVTYNMDCPVFVIYNMVCPIYVIYNMVCPIYVIYNMDCPIYVIYNMVCPIYVIYNMVCPIYVICEVNALMQIIKVFKPQLLIKQSFSLCGKYQRVQILANLGFWVKIEFWLTFIYCLLHNWFNVSLNKILLKI